MTELPRLFRDVFTETIFGTWVAMGQPPVVTVALKEPMKPPLLDGPCGDETVIVVSVRCRNVRGVLRYEATNPAMLACIEAWSDQWKDKTADDFKMPAWARP